MDFEIMYRTNVILLSTSTVIDNPNKLLARQHRYRRRRSGKQYHCQYHAETIVVGAWPLLLPHCGLLAYPRVLQQLRRRWSCFLVELKREK
jgi:hypothetical protein